MLRILLIDDKRQIQNVHREGGYQARIARTFQEGIEVLAGNPQFDILYVDHDLEEKDDRQTGYGIMCWLEEHQDKLPKMVKCVSSNPPGRKSIEQVLARFYELDFTTRYWGLLEPQYRMKEGE